jgi:hypothetical protein
MSFWPVPDIMKDNIYEIGPRLFTNRGIKFVMLDVDNTLSPYTINDATPRLTAWIQGMKDAGLELFILSNNKGDRPKIFAEALGLDYVKRAHKPFTKVATQVLSEKGYAPNESALIGDQIYTDALCAKCLGAMAVVVRPILFSNIWLRLRYYLEAPFRLKYKWKKMK